MIKLYPKLDLWLHSEIWKPVVTPYADYTNLYSISSLGRVWIVEKEIKYKNRTAIRVGKFMKQMTTKNGRLEVGLTNGKFIKRERIHRLIAYVFLDNPNNYPQINHIDGNPKNNNIDNLEWCSASENMFHAHKHNLIKKKIGIDSPLSKYSLETITALVYDLKNTNLSIPELAIKHNVTKGCISGIQYGDSWSHLSGFHKDMKWQRKNSLEKRAKSIKDSGFNYNRTEIIVINKETNDIIEFDSATECAKFLNVSGSMITYYLDNKYKNKKYKIKRKQDYINNTIIE